ncbi:MAG TPA: diacylglycerol kinase family protein [Acidimicrobiales bacterium]|nr:diacylglycerol kinase family protein [Acidimicrobiales bacterium]
MITPNHPVLIVNPISGGGKAHRHNLVGQCRARGIEPLVVESGRDISAMADAAVSRGADIVGMAGGDGSQAVVAAIAAAHDLPFVCVPAGTRNHFALDIGLDRDDLVGALDAFFDGEERRIDLARVNDRVFVNNASMGLYGAIVQSQEYRNAKLRTVIEKTPELLGPGAEPFDLRFTGPDGKHFSGVQLLLVSNNRYELDPVGRQGTRGGMDQGTLGVVVVHAGPPLHNLREWVTPTFRVDSGSAVDVGLDGEAVVLDPPLIFESLPSALRLRVPVRSHHPRKQAPALAQNHAPGPPTLLTRHQQIRAGSGPT